MGSRVTGDWSANDREYMLSNEGFHILDCIKSVDRITIAFLLFHSKTRRLQNYTVVCGLSDK